MTLVTMKKLLENGVHFGHQTKRWDPKCKPFIYTAKNGIHIIDLNKSLEYLNHSYAALKKIAEEGGKVLFVGTKKQAQQTIVDEALRSGSFYINQRWLGGTLTNFKTIQKRIKRLIEIEEMEANGSINNYPKKEVATLRKQADRLRNFLGGIKEMKKLPDALVVVDPKEEYIAVLEARKLNIPVFGLIDTNASPDIVDYPIPANDDAIKSIRLLISLLSDAIVEAKGGILQDAYQEKYEDDFVDITMEDVIINVEKHIEEQIKRRKQEDKRRSQRRFNPNSEKRFFSRKDQNKEENNTGDNKEEQSEANENTETNEVVNEVKSEAKGE